MEQRFIAGEHAEEGLTAFGTLDLKSDGLPRAADASEQFSAFDHIGACERAVECESRIFQLRCQSVFHFNIPRAAFTSGPYLGESIA